MKAWLDREPWSDTYALRIAMSTGKSAIVASGVDDKGNIVWKNQEKLEVIEPFLNLRQDVLDAVGRAFGEVIQATDATVAHLADARAVRDRLLVLVEKGWNAS